MRASGVNTMNVAMWPGSAAIRRGLLLACAFLVCAIGASAAQAAVGVLDASYADTGPPPVHQPTAPTGEKPQSKLWFNDGIWWGSIWSKTKYTIQRYDVSGTWVDTGVVIDPRDKSQADMLWDGTHLYAISNVHEASSTLDPAVRLYRFSYNATTKTYSPDAGFPVVIFQPASTTDLETVVMDKDSTGMLWATFTYANVPGSCVTLATCPAGRSVYTAHSTTSDTAWSTPAVLPLARAANVSGNDISSIVHFGNKIGVLFSDQVPDPGPATSMTGDYFAVHVDGQPDSAWTQETALFGKRAADDHINLKAAPDGRLYAAVKTSANDAGTPVASDPLIYLLERTTAGVWSTFAFSTVASQETRSQILLDPTHGVVYQFATFPPDGAYEAGGKIYCKVTSMDSPSFDAGPGSPFIDLAPGDHLNNFSTTKQTVSPASGLLGIAADDHNLHYAHNSLALTGAPSCQGAPIVPPVVVTPPASAPAGRHAPGRHAPGRHDEQPVPGRLLERQGALALEPHVLAQADVDGAPEGQVDVLAAPQAGSCARQAARRRGWTGERVPQEGHDQDDPGAPDPRRTRAHRAQGACQGVRDHPHSGGQGTPPRARLVDDDRVPLVAPGFRQHCRSRHPWSRPSRPPAKVPSRPPVQVRVRDDHVRRRPHCVQSSTV